MLAIRKRLEDRDEGFTLIELLIVVIIIGILAAVAIPTFLNQRQRAFRAAVQSDLRNVAVEAETWFTDNQTYVGFIGAAGPPATGLTAFRNSPNVTFQDVEAADFTAGSYCIEAQHASLTTETWVIRPGNQLGRVGAAGFATCG